METKSTFKGRIISIQPRSVSQGPSDESSHTYLGYAVTLDGEIYDQTQPSIGIGKAAHAKHQFKVNDIISGECVPVPDPDTEPTEYYKVSKLKLITRSTTITNTSSPWELVPPGWKFTEKEDTADWQPGHMTRSVVAACGELECLLRLL